MGLIVATPPMSIRGVGASHVDGRELDAITASEIWRDLAEVHA